MGHVGSRFLFVFTPIVLVLSLIACSNNSVEAPPPPPAQFTIAGTAVNLAGSTDGVVLQNNGRDNLTVTANATFQFPATLACGSSYNVTVLTQPSGPVQTCGVLHGSGTATGNVTNIEVDCGHDEWVWVNGSQSSNQFGIYGTLGTPAAGNTPGGRQSPATWTDKSGRLWLFGGYGYDSNGVLMPMNDLWESGAGQWTWMGGPLVAGGHGNYGTLGIPSPNNIPGARFEAISYTDATGNLWLFGGNGFDSVGNELPLNDLWEYSNGQWTWIGGAKIGPANGVYGPLGVASSTNIPGGRGGAVKWMDSSGDLWLFGGIGYDESHSTPGLLNDLWKYSGGEWTWMGGSKIWQQSGVYGTQGVASSSNIPGGREGGFSWADGSGTLWLFGGEGLDVNGATWVLNDLWKYKAGQWTWVAGSNVMAQHGVYGTQGTPAANNIPGARWMGSGWSDASGSFWLFGGNGFASVGNSGLLNDLWKFSNGQWTWINGSNLINENPSFGTQGALGPGNTPGGREFLNSWVDTDGNLWLFGGYGQTAAGAGNLNDLWMYEP